jgi:hypothetical protein
MAVWPCRRGGVERSSYIKRWCRTNAHRAGLGARRRDYRCRGGRGGLRETDRGSAHRVQRAQVPERAAPLPGALRRGWPRRLVVNRRGADARRERALRDIPTREGFDRDEYPPAVGRGRGPGLTRGRNPRGWKADVRYVPSSENRSHGATLGDRLEPFCNGTRFRYVFR